MQRRGWCVPLDLWCQVLRAPCRPRHTGTAEKGKEAPESPLVLLAWLAGLGKVGITGLLKVHHQHRSPRLTVTIFPTHLFSGFLSLSNPPKTGQFAFIEKRNPGTPGSSPRWPQVSLLHPQL